MDNVKSKIDIRLTTSHKMALKKYFSKLHDKECGLINGLYMIEMSKKKQLQQAKLCRTTGIRSIQTTHDGFFAITSC